MSTTNAIDILREQTKRTDWNDTNLLEIVCQYIDNQQDNECFEEFCIRQAAEEASKPDL